MSLQTQMSGGYGENRELVFQLKAKLEAIDIHVTHPLGDGFFVIEENIIEQGKRGHQAYEILLDYYGSIVTSNFHIICNNEHGKTGYLNRNVVLEILYAMVKRKPVIFLHPPRFTGDIDSFSRKMIERYLHQMIVCDLLMLDTVDLKRLLSGIAHPPTAYALTNDDRAHIQRLVRTYFRNLLGCI